MKIILIQNTILLIAALLNTLYAQDNSLQKCKPDNAFTTLADDGAWCWFSDPRAVYFEGEHRRIYTGWMNSLGDLVAGCYDIDTRQVTTQVIHKNLEIDDHDNPSLIIDNKGYVTYYYTKHAFKTPLLTVRSKRPEDISEWAPVRELHLNDTIAYKEYRNSYTYANIYQLADENNRQYLFWRGMDFKPNFSFSDDQGNSWSNGKILILPDRTYRDRRPYLKVSSNGKDKIHFAFTDGHPRDEPTNSIYYACCKNGKILQADGSEICRLDDAPFEPSEADVVYDARQSGVKSWIWDIAEDTLGNPVIVYSRFPDDSNHLYHYARWNGTQWEDHFLLNSGGWFPQTPEGKHEREPNYSGGIVIDHEDPSVVYLSAKTDGTFEIEKWKTFDGGTNWEIEKITCRSQKDNVRPFAVRNANSDKIPQVIWMNIEKYIHYTNYKASLMIKAK
ncbi:MAG: BNR-4 repeat-containing protein [Bacteroidales bacterium]|nr:BNR-4 repeat-containing protein [Bacteroidales bacterium]